MVLTATMLLFHHVFVYFCLGAVHDPADEFIVGCYLGSYHTAVLSCHWCQHCLSVILLVVSLSLVLLPLLLYVSADNSSSCTPHCCWLDFGCCCLCHCWFFVVGCRMRKFYLHSLATSLLLVATLLEDVVVAPKVVTITIVTCGVIHAALQPPSTTHFPGKSSSCLWTITPIKVASVNVDWFMSFYIIQEFAVFCCRVQFCSFCALLSCSTMAFCCHGLSAIALRHCIHQHDPPHPMPSRSTIATCPCIAICRCDPPPLSTAPTWCFVFPSNVFCCRFSAIMFLCLVPSSC